MNILTVLVLYLIVFVVVWYDKRKLDASERKTFLVLYFFWSILIFIANYVGYLLGILSFLPWWPNNFLHTFVWIGVCLTYLFLALRQQHQVVQFMAFASFSLVVRYAEFKIFGVWEMDHFLHVIRGNDAYIIGWSFIDGFFGVVTMLVLKLFSKWIDGLVVVSGNRAKSVLTDLREKMAELK